MMGLPETAFEAVEGRDLAGKVFLVTGGYSGLGAASSEALAKAGATVIVAGRNAESQAAFASKIGADGDKTLDLGDLASVRAFSEHVMERYATIDVLMANAGVMNTPAGTTKDGFEVQFGTNVIGHFLLAKLLAPRTKRQVWLSSRAHLLTGEPPGDVFDPARAPRIDLDAVTKVDEASYDGWYRYQQSKLGDVMLAKQFLVEFDHLEGCSVHPGVVRTNLGRHLSFLTIARYVWRAITGRGSPVQTPQQGARTQTLCAVRDDLVAGAYYAECVVDVEADAAKDMDAAKQLYDYCDEATKTFQ